MTVALVKKANWVQQAGLSWWNGCTGYDWDDAGNLWATTNARDNLDGPLHDNLPDDTLMYVPAGTQDGAITFGFPYCHWWGLTEPGWRRLRLRLVLNWAYDAVVVPCAFGSQSCVPVATHCWGHLPLSAHIQSQHV